MHLVACESAGHSPKTTLVRRVGMWAWIAWLGLTVVACVPPEPPPWWDAGIDAAGEGGDAREETPEDGAGQDRVGDGGGGIDADAAGADVGDGDAPFAEGGDADASVPDSAEVPDAVVADGGLAEEASLVLHCGDGVRDPGTEECDDGLRDAGSSRACSPACTVVDRLVETESEVLERYLGTGRHPVAAGSSGQAVATIEVHPADAADQPRLSVTTYSAVGVRQGTAHIGDALYDAAPVLAPLPDGSFAVAFNSLTVDGDGLGVALARVTADGSAIGPVAHANTITLFGQHSPDAIGVGTEIVVGWQDDSPAWGSTVCVRRFNSGLAPIDIKESCEPEAAANLSHIVLASLGSTVARAWRQDATDADAAGTGKIALASGAWSTAFAFDALPAADEAPALASIDAAHLLLVYTDGDGVQKGVVVDESGATAWPLRSLGAGRYSPAVAVTAEGICLAWREKGATVDGAWDPNYDELYLQKLAWDGSELTNIGAPLPLPRVTAHRLGDQIVPALAGAPQGAILAAWDDRTSTNFAGECKHGDVVVELIPTPIRRGTP